MWTEIFSHLIADAIFLVMLILVGWSFYLFARRRKLLKFFGINSTKELIVYLSNIRVIRGGSVGIDNAPRAYAGSTVVFGEAIQANLFPNLFSYLIPGLENQPGILKFLLVSDINITIQTSPILDNDIIRNSPIITFGSPGYNKVSGWFEGTLMPLMTFANDNSEIHINDLPNDINPLHSFIQRRFDQENGRMAFYVAGLTEISTVGAAYYLLTHWRDLYNRYHADQPFSVLISVNATNYKLHTIVVN